MVYRLASVLAFCMVSLVANAVSDIVVTTTADQVTLDDECSLREAVNYINAGLLEAEGDCKPEDDSATTEILLDSEETYVIESVLPIRASMTIRADNIFGVADQPADEQPIIQSQGRVFLIDDGSAFPVPIEVVVAGVVLEGPAAGLSTAEGITAQEQGGLIFNREDLTLNQVTLSGGVALEGGAVYNSSLDAFLELNQTLLQNNFADQGAAVYSEVANFALNQVTVSQNGQIDDSAEGFSVFLEEVGNIPPFDEEPEEGDEPELILIDRGSLSMVNVIFFDNNTGAVLFKPSLSANNLTVVNNLRGVKFDAQLTILNQGNRRIIASRLANSVVLGNEEYDLFATAEDDIFLNHIAYNSFGGGFDTQDTNRSTNLNNLNLTQLQLEGLIASESVEIDEETVEICPVATIGEEIGLFCPLVRANDDYLPTIKPRLFLTYDSLSESPIVNSGLRSSISGQPALNCAANDIRGQNRPACDLGAFELVVFADGAGNNELNESIFFGQVATLDLTNAIGDGQLVPAELCASLDLPLDETDQSQIPTGENMSDGFTDGCIRFVVDRAPQKGSIAVLPNGLIQYTPSSNFQGTDTFEYRAVTTTSRFSGANNDRYLTVRTQILQDPESGLTSDTIGVYGDGAASINTWLLLLLSIFGLGRFASLQLSKN